MCECGTVTDGYGRSEGPGLVWLGFLGLGFLVVVCGSTPMALSTSGDIRRALHIWPGQMKDQGVSEAGEDRRKKMFKQRGAQLPPKDPLGPEVTRVHVWDVSQVSFGSPGVLTTLMGQ